MTAQSSTFTGEKSRGELSEWKDHHPDSVIMDVMWLRCYQMLRTFNVPFDFHAPNGGRRLFGDFASSLSTRFDTEPQILDDPIFSYALHGHSQLDRLRVLDESRPAIVYLSNIAMHSAVLILGNFDDSDLVCPFSYSSLASFCNEPFSRGFSVCRDAKLKSTFDSTTVVISDLAQFRNDDNELPDRELFRVLNRIEDVFVCNILNYDRYFDHVSVHGDEPFFLNADADVNLRECVRQLAHYSLREYLIDQSVPFATLGDDHMDDEYAVSYGMACWRFSDDDVAFVR